MGGGGVMVRWKWGVGGRQVNCGEGCEEFD
jgi:hypothetical protein